MTPKLIRAINDWPQNARGAIACDAVAALSVSPDPAALVTVDSISRKFKFRQVKAAATAALESAAKELGITTEELADRIVPTLDFAPDGTRIFDYGSRKFIVRLTPSLELVVNTEAGKTVKSMPAPGKTDDAEKATAAYEAYKTLKKTAQDHCYRTACPTGIGAFRTAMLGQQSLAKAVCGKSSNAPVCHQPYMGSL